MNLSEQIQECGDEFGALIKHGNMWAVARKGQVLRVPLDFIYNTPEEAVQALFDKIHA